MEATAVMNPEVMYVHRWRVAFACLPHTKQTFIYKHGYVQHVHGQ